MGDPKLPTAKRRLSAMLSDENYGPKLARLSREDERRVLDLIYENKGREARRVLDQLDDSRRLSRRVRDVAKRYAGKTKSQRTATWKSTRSSVADAETEFWNLYKSMVLQ